MYQILSCIIQRTKTWKRENAFIQRKAKDTTEEIFLYRKIWNALSCKERKSGLLQSDIKEQSKSGTEIRVTVQYDHSETRKEGVL